MPPRVPPAALPVAPGQTISAKCIGTSRLPFTPRVKASPCRVTLQSSHHCVYNLSSNVAGWSSPVARRAHNPKVAGSNPAPATITFLGARSGAFFVARSQPLRRAARPCGWDRNRGASGNHRPDSRKPRRGGGAHEYWQSRGRRVLRHLLARLRGHRRRGPRGIGGEQRDRLAGRLPRLRAHGRDHGLRRRPHLRRALQPGGHHRPLGRRAVPRRQGRDLHRRPGDRRHLRVGGPLRDRLGQGRLQPLRRLRRQRLRRPLAGGLLAGRGDRHRDAADAGLPARHPRRHRPARARRASRRWPSASP